MLKKSIVILTIGLAIALLYFIYLGSGVENTYGFNISKNDIRAVKKDIEAYYSAIDNHNVEEMIKYTIDLEPEGRIEFLKEAFKNDFSLSLKNLEVLHDFPISEFDNARYVEEYDIKKAIVIKAEFSFDSIELPVLMGMDAGEHKIFLYVALAGKSKQWQIIDMSTIDPYK